MANGGKVIVKIDGDTNKFKEKFDKLKGYAGKAAKGIAVGFTATAGAVAAVGTAAVKAYGDYEQLVGGIETLFGTGGQTLEEYAASTKRTTKQAAKDYEKLTAIQEKMFNNAHSAFERAGMSANTYMETATSFAASLVSSLGGDTEKAADYADRAMVDMSDNANKMGTNLEMIQNAYQGFAKQNYTMLDNLKLGYGGTQEEMKRLIKDASKMKDVQKELGVTVDANSMSFGNIVNAISVMQKSMGIAGTTAKEATTTIQGSLNMTKAAWENLMIALADPEGNVDEAMNDLIFAAEKVGENMLPIIQNVLNKIPEMITGLGSTIVSKLPDVVNTILPQLAESAAQLLAVLINTVSENSDSIVNTAFEIVKILIDGIISAAPDLLTASLNIIVSLCQGLTQSLPELIPVMVEAVSTMVDTLIDNAGKFFGAGEDLMLTLADGLIEALPKLVEAIPEIIIRLSEVITQNAPRFADSAGQLIGGLAAGLILNLPQLLVASAKLVISLAKSLITFTTKELPKVGLYVIKGIWEGIKNNTPQLWDNLKKWCSDMVNKIKEYFGIHSPSTVMRDEVGKYISEGIAKGISKSKDTIISAIESIGEDTRTEVQKVTDDMNAVILDSEKKYNEESLRIQKEKSKSKYEQSVLDAKAKYEQDLKKAKTSKQIADARAKYEKKLQKATNKATKEEQDRANEEYLDGLKKAAEAERKIYDALQKDIENQKNKIKTTFKELAESAMDSIEEIAKAQETLSDKLKNWGSLYTTDTYNIGGVKYSVANLSDLSKQNEQLKEYADTLLQVKERGNVPMEFFSVLRGLSAEDGLAFAKGLLSTSDTEFTKYINDWKEKQESADVISKFLYADETQNATEEISKKFDDFNSDIEKKGKENAASWGEGFFEEIRKVMPEIQSRIRDSISSIAPYGTIVPAMAGTNISNTSNVFNISSNSNETNTDTLTLYHRWTKLQEARGSY